MKLATKFIIDTNVGVQANKALDVDSLSEMELDCAENCVKLLKAVCLNTSGIVLDSDNEIFNEYRKRLSMSGQPGVGDMFMKWVHRNLGYFDLVPITKSGDTYIEFPSHPGLANFDPSDRKFVAVANAHKKNPTVYQATDSKWWGWRKALKGAGIEVEFICPQYIEAKYNKKFPTDNNAKEES